MRAPKLGEDDDDDVPITITTARGRGRSVEGDDVGPEVMVDPASAAVFSCIPSAVEQWVVQQWGFRVLFMDSVLLRSAAEEFGCAGDVQVVSHPPSQRPRVSLTAPSAPHPRKSVEGDTTTVTHVPVTPAAAAVAASAPTPAAAPFPVPRRGSTVPPAAAAAAAPPEVLIPTAPNPPLPGQIEGSTRYIATPAPGAAAGLAAAASPLSGKRVSTLGSDVASSSLGSAGAGRSSGNAAAKDGTVPSFSSKSLPPSSEGSMLTSQSSVPGEAAATAGVAAAGTAAAAPAKKKKPTEPRQRVVKSDPAYQQAAVRRQVIMAILFADIVGYSKMGEMQVLTFVERFLGSVAALLESLPSIGIKGCATKNTWGDAIYMVFSRVPDAGTVALLLSDLVQRVPWHKLGLPKSLSIRISLHAAPVHPVVDPITGTKNYTGVHTSRAARIEPITPPGCVYCSQAFAAIAETLCVTQYECTYVGNVPLAKGYGLQPVYHVRWGNSLAGRKLQDLLEDHKDIIPVLPTGVSRDDDDEEEEEAPLVAAGPTSQHSKG